MLLFALCLYVSGLVLHATIIIQFLWRLVTGNTNSRLLELGEGLSSYAYQILRYLSYGSDKKPFPFNDWPAGRVKPAKSAAAKSSVPAKTDAASAEPKARKTTPRKKKADS